MGKVSIKRKPSGLFAMFGKLPVTLDKVKMEGLKRDESRVYEFEGPEASLTVGSGFMASKPIQVQDGQEVEVSTQVSSYLLWITGLILCVLIRGSIILSLLGLGCLATAFFLPFFKAQILEK